MDLSVGKLLLREAAGPKAEAETVLKLPLSATSGNSSAYMRTPVGHGDSARAAPGGRGSGRPGGRGGSRGGGRATAKRSSEQRSSEWRSAPDSSGMPAAGRGRGEHTPGKGVNSSRGRGRGGRGQTHSGGAGHCRGRYPRGEKTEHHDAIVTSVRCVPRPRRRRLA